MCVCICPIVFCKADINVFARANTCRSSGDICMSMHAYSGDMCMSTNTLTQAGHIHIYALTYVQGKLFIRFEVEFPANGDVTADGVQMLLKVTKCVFVYVSNYLLVWYDVMYSWMYLYIVHTYIQI